MGYYTAFTLIVREDGEQYDSAEFSPELVEALNEFFEQVNEDQAYTNSKWYDFESDMRVLSEKFPSLLFVVHGEGEESADLWDCYVQNGKLQMCQAKITYPPYDKERMK